MSLQQTADEVMAYLDSVGVAAEYIISNHSLTIDTDDVSFTVNKNASSSMIGKFKLQYPQKSPN